MAGSLHVDSAGGLVDVVCVVLSEEPRNKNDSPADIDEEGEDEVPNSNLVLDKSEQEGLDTEPAFLPEGGESSTESGCVGDHVE